MTVFLSAKESFKDTKERVKSQVKELQEKGVTPGFGMILTVSEDEDPALNKTQKMFAKLKTGDCKEVGIESEIIQLYEMHTSKDLQTGLSKCLDEMNTRDDITGTIIQFPPSKYIDKFVVLRELLPSKDVDGLTPHNVGIWMHDGYDIYKRDVPLPCTAAGIIELLDEWYGKTKDPKLEIRRKKVTVIGKSYLVGKTTSKFFLDRHATVTVCHSETKNIQEEIKEADMVISAVGRPPEVYGDKNPFRLTHEMIKKDGVIISVGLQKHPVTEKIYYDLPSEGDAEYEHLMERASYISPNMGGIGLKTRGRILENNVITARLRSPHIIQKGYVK